MNYEEKQRLIALRDNMKSYGYMDGVEELESIFPELAESEDEKAIKLIRSLLVNVRNVQSNTSLYKQYDDALAWLEKQKEEEGYEAVPVESTLEYKLGFKAGKESEKQKDSLKDFIDDFPYSDEQKEQKPAEWSEEDETILELFLGWLEGAMGEKTYSSWLKSLPKRFSLQPKQEWSEEDEKMLTDISWAIRHCAYDDKKKERVMKWFNDDYRKFLRPHWKPSEVQIHAVIEALKYLPNNKDEWRILNTLVDVFKKLM